MMAMLTDTPVVMKFGGTSVRDADAIRRLIDIVGRETRPRLVVVSALAGVTDTLVDLGSTARGSGSLDPMETVETLRTRHLALVEELVDAEERAPMATAIEQACDELQLLVSAVGVVQELSPRSADAIHAFGEGLSSQLVAATLDAAGTPARWIDATTLLVTDGSHGRAQPRIDLTHAQLDEHVAPLMDAGIVVVVAGFVGATDTGVVTTLGRGGSDYSAAIFGAALDAAEIQIWTDVDGILTADPRLVDDARLVPKLTFAEASELAYFGAKVLHPATIQPAVAKDIAVRILNSRNPDGRGTEVTKHGTGDSPVTAIASKRGLTVIEVESARMLMAHGFLKRLFDVFDRFETAVDVVTTSEVDVSITIDNDRHLDELVAELSTFAEVRTVPHMALLCVVGETLNQDLTLFPQVVEALGVPCRMVSQSASRRNLTFVMREADLPTALNRLHSHFFARVEA